MVALPGPSLATHAFTLPFTDPKRIAAIADVFRTEGRFSILHDGARRRQTITANPTRDVQSFVADARRILAAKVPLPKGVYLEFAGAAEAHQSWNRPRLGNDLLEVTRKRT